MAELDDESPSPKNRLKFLCSYGGKILPRPTDGQLRYVGGETRVLAVPRSITISELKEKINGMFSAVVVMKYQVMPEDIDTLVSVRSEEDLHHMLDEYDRHDRPRSPTSAGSARFRLFLFSSSLPHAVDLPCADIINGGATAPTAANICRPFVTMSSSACTSPTSTIDSTSTIHVKGGGMHRVRSTPNLSGSQSSHHHPQQRAAAAYGSHAVIGGGPWRAGGAQLMGSAGPVRYERGGGGCGCGCHRPQPVRRCFYSPAAVGSGGFLCGGHLDEACARTSLLNFAAAGAPPRKPTGA